MFHLRIITFFLFSLFLTNLQLFGTKIYPTEKKCPVCLKEFIITKFSSYSSFGESERDLSGGNYPRMLTCANCLYSSLENDFDQLGEVEREILLKVLPNIKLKLEPFEKKSFSKISFSEKFVAYLLARECNKIRGLGKKSNMDFLLQQYYLTKNGHLSQLHPYYRKETIKELKSLLDSVFYKDKERAMYTYLLGEFYRLDGQDKKALSQFKKALEYTKELPSEEKWIEKWSIEQSCRINFPKLSIQSLAEFLNDSNFILDDKEKAVFERDLALQVLASKNDPSSWGIISKYVMQDISRLAHLDSIVELTKEKLQIDKRFWRWIQEQYLEAERKAQESDIEMDLIWKNIHSRFFKFSDKYRGEHFEFHEEVKSILSLKDETVLLKYTTKAGDTLKRIAYKNHTSVSRILELNPQLNNEDRVAENITVELVKTPAEYSEAVFLSHIGKLIAANNKGAEKYFFYWIKTIGSNNFYKFNFCTLNCLLALKSHKENWQMPAMGDLNANEEQRMIYQCLLMIKGNEKAEEKLLAYIQSQNKNGISIPLGILRSCNSKKAKNLVIEGLKEMKICHVSEATSYLFWVATLADIPTIEENIKVFDSTLGAEQVVEKKFLQMCAETIITRIKFQNLVNISMSKKNK